MMLDVSVPHRTMDDIQAASRSPHRLLVHRGLVLVTGLLLSGFILLFVAGCLRYGGPDGLLLRVQAEVASHKPHPDLVPTPLPTPTGGAALALLPPVVAAAVPATVAPALPTASPTSTRATPTVPVSLSNSSADDTLPPVFVPSDVPQEPTATPTFTPIPPPTATLTPIPPPQQSAVQLAGFSHLWQTWNNCGPATLAMNLSYYGSELGQADVARVLKPDGNDKNVSPHEMAAFAQAHGYEAMVRVNGDEGRLRRLVEAGVPVLVETWLEHDGGMGHYRLVTGYDKSRREWIVYDSYVSEGVDPNKPYPGIRISYDEMAQLWRVFQGTHVLVFDEARAPIVQAILGPDVDDVAMWERALAGAQADAQQHADDAFAWFNLGSSLAALGRYEEATIAYDQARVIGLPWRMLWYQFGPFIAYYETGRFDELIALADATIATAGNIEETFFWKGMGLKAIGDLEGARRAFERALELNPNYAEARAALDGG